MFSVFRGFIPVYYSDYLGNNFHWEFFKGFFFFFDGDHFKAFMECVTILLLFQVLVFLAVRRVGSYLPGQ